MNGELGTGSRCLGIEPDLGGNVSLVAFYLAEKDLGADMGVSSLVKALTTL